MKYMGLEKKSYPNSRYSKKEIEYIINNAEQKTVEEIAEHLGRTIRGVRGKINSLGIKLQHLNRGNDFVKYNWTKEEEATLKTLAGTMSDKDIYTKYFYYLPNESWVYKKRRALGLNGKQPYKHGTFYLAENGYKIQFVNGKTIWEHREIVEKELGRKLEKTEIVHHINGNKTDNRIENLFVCESKKEHKNIHCQLEQIAYKLIEKDIIGFNKETGEYFIKSK